MQRGVSVHGLGEELHLPEFVLGDQMSTWGTPSTRGRGVRGTLLQIMQMLHHGDHVENHHFVTNFENPLHQHKVFSIILEHSECFLDIT